MSTQEHPDPVAADFGTNEWLIEELFEQYQKDPDLVDPAWWDFFKDYQPGNGAADGAAPPPNAPLPTRPAAQQPSASGQPASAGTSERPDAPPADPTPAPEARSTTDEREARPSARPGSDTAEGSPAPAPQARPAPSAQRVAEAVAEEPAPEAAAQPAVAGYTSTPASRQPASAPADGTVKLRGPAARVVKNMDASLEVPTATSVRAVPAKLLADNRIVINNHLARGRGGKVSFTHLIGYAVVEALGKLPEMNAAYAELDGKPAVTQPGHVNFGLAIDLPKPDGTRQLLVPSIKAAEEMDFAQFRVAYEDLVRKARGGKLTVEDFAGTTITLTNPGTIGTVHSMPRLMVGQGTIVGVGALDYPAEYKGASEETLARAGVSKILTLTSTYDHRIIQGAASGEFLRVLEEKLLGQDGFYDRVFASLRVPYEPVRWQRDVHVDPETDMGKPARIAEVIHAYRSRGHLMADTDPLTYRQRRHPDLDITNHGLSLWDLDRTFPTGGFAGTSRLPFRDILGILRDTYCRTIGIEYMHLQDPVERRWMQARLETPYQKPTAEQQLHILHKLGQAEAFETFLQTKFVGQKRFSLEGGESLIPMLDTILTGAARDGLDEVAIGMAHRGRLNVLANIAGKSYAQIFSEFEGNQDPRSIQGS
ncbi:MAG TPA: multifunctional oxoglutarate decarboxylase/oxoglutarate dehydrogenase thiamine pyrophosphate-binding subunit/dihydrolipoyllysine-residue succinyltransferase subunit, partial [Phototrophicaceae bacterium]|nr:multifunctional oxoglutarate decarboxylase/oxoglutarate dehydrogenase thiamine pyrophosphate-binding subunit/dihydrolipoyllysine-residue succinyltransferase subunit [Phototrophicaceae bacterium]